MQEKNLKFYATSHRAMLGLAADPDILYVGDTKTNQAFAFDNQQEEWQKSIYLLSEICVDPEFKEVGKNWENGYVSVLDAIDFFTATNNKQTDNKQAGTEYRTL